MMLNEAQIIEDKQIREQCIDRIDALEKVKKLFLIPEMKCMTIRQVAEYYEVDTHTIQMCYERNKDEVDLDGVSNKTPVDFKKIFKDTSCAFKDLKQLHGKLIVQIDDSITFEIPNCGIRVFPKRAILRIGMLLRDRDSEIAKKVRTQLLNSFEHTSDENKTAEINEELKLMTNIGIAYASGKSIEILNATMALDQYRQRYINQLEDSNKTLISEKKILAGEILKWTDRNSANKLIRTFANLMKITYASAYTLLYDELLYKHRICLKARGDKPWINHLRDDEWCKLFQTVSAICEEHNINTKKLFKKAKIDISGLNERN